MYAKLNIEEMEVVLGENIKKLRLQKNLDRETLATQAGISVTAIKNLESGKGATTKTLLKVIRSLGREDWLRSLAPIASINPLHMVKNRPIRQRASGRRLSMHGNDKK